MTAPGERVRVVVAMPGDDAGEHVAVAVARGLRDEGMEVVYAGRRPSAEQLADTVVQEDADAVGLPVLPGDAAALLTELGALLAERGAEDVVVFTCGADGDLPGATRTFPAGTGPAEIARWLREQISR